MAELKHIRVRYLNKTYHVGYFADELEAAKAYDIKAKSLHKEYGRFNFE